MLFNSFEFALFFPAVTLAYFLLPHRARWAWLLLASAFFYATFVPGYLLILAGLIAVDYAAGLLIAGAPTATRRRLWLVASLVANVGTLAFFKYFNFFNDNVRTLLGMTGLNYAVANLKIILPIGLSFHTFQSMSYTIEVYRGRQKVERHLGIYALYVLFYPQLVAGPIERPQNLLHQFHERHDPSYERITRGLKRMFVGLFKKIVIADGLAPFVNAVYDNPHAASTGSLWLATYFFAFQIFCDFSGYSDIALGAADIMGIDLMVNFRRPYLATSIAEFWRRWHISLSTWFRDYLYIPLGGSRCATPRRYRNLLTVFLVSGLWHGASWTFLVWGAIHGVFMVVSDLCAGRVESFAARRSDFGRRIMRLAGWALTFHVVVLAWVFFRANSLADAFYVVAHLVPRGGAGPRLAPTADFDQLALAAALIAALLLAQLFEERRPFWQRLALRPVAVRWAVYYACAAGFVYAVLAQGGAAKAQQFIYFQF